MRTIYKYPLELDVEQTITGPIMEFLHLDWQNGQLCVWAEVDTDEAEETHHFYIVGTGHQVPSAAVDHVGTVLSEDGMFVWHVYTQAFWSDDERWVRAPEKTNRRDGRPPSSIQGFRLIGDPIVDEAYPLT